MTLRWKSKTLIEISPWERRSNKPSSMVLKRLPRRHLWQRCRSALCSFLCSCCRVSLGEAVVFAMLASYMLSRTVVPTMAKFLLRGHEHDAEHTKPSRNPLVRMQVRFEHAFERLRDSYHGVLERCLHHRRAFLIAFFAVC